MRESDEPLTDTLVRCLADSMDLKALERLENDGDQAGARLMRARLADQTAVRLQMGKCSSRSRVCKVIGRYINSLYRCDGTLSGRSDTLLKGTHLSSQS